MEISLYTLKYQRMGAEKELTYIFYMGFPGINLHHIPNNEPIEVIANKVCEYIECKLTDLQMTANRFRTTEEMKLKRCALVAFLRQFKAEKKLMFGKVIKEHRFTEPEIGTLLGLKRQSVNHLLNSAKNMLDPKFGYQAFKDIWHKLSIITSEEL